MPGKITVMRAADGAAKPEKTEIFAEGLNRPYGIAFYPPGPNPQYVYVGETNQDRALSLQDRRPEGDRQAPK